MKKAIKFKIVFSFILLLTAVFCFDISVAAEDAGDNEIYYCIDDTAYTVSGNGSATINGESITIGTDLTVSGDYLLKFTNDGVSVSNYVYLWKAGDAYTDDKINVVDLVAAKESESGMKNATKSGARAADINSDDVIDSEDLKYLRKMLLGDEAFTKVASIVKDDGTTYYDSFTEAIGAANSLGGVGNQEAVEVMLHRDVTVNSQTDVAKNITIINASGKKITINRDSAFSGTMFDVNTSNVTFTLGRRDENVSDMLVIDASSESAVGGRTIYNQQESSTFVLCENATLTGARSTLAGAAFANKGTACLYGNMTDNGSTSNGGAINHASQTKKLYIYSGDYSNNVAALNCGGVIYNSAPGGVVIEGGTFANNQASQGGVIYRSYYLEVPDGLTITGGTFKNNQATYNANSGGALYLLRTTAKITGGTFTGNKATYRGGAIQCSGDDEGTCQLIVTGGTFTKNESQLQGGGAFSLLKTNADISGAIVRGNVCGGTDSDNYMGGGAILIHQNSQVTLSDCRIDDNTQAGTEVDDGHDIGFWGTGDEKLILKDSSFKGSVCWLFGDNPAIVEVQERLETDDSIISDPITLKRGAVCTVDYTSGMLVSPYYEYSDVVYNRSQVNGKFACYFIRGDVGMNTFDNNTVSGDSTLLVAPDGTTMLIDCNMTSTASHVVAALKRLGIEKIDHFVVSHAHGDHVGGWPTLLRYFDIGQVYITGSLLYNSVGNEYVTGFLDALQEKSIPYKTIAQGDTWSFGGASVNVLWPGKDTDWENCEPDDSTQNNYSAVLKVTYSNSSFLFGGDIEEATENVLINQYGSGLHADIVKMNHHGQFYTSEKNTWLDTVEPKISVAEHYAVHSEERVQRYTKRGIVPLFTGLDKTCLVYTSGDGTYDVQVEKDRCYYTTYLPSMTNGHFKVGTSAVSITGNTVNYLQNNHLMLHGGNNASNEDELRELLRSDENLTITVTGNIDIHRELVVYGKKKIQGSNNATLTMWLAATDEQAVINVQEGASLEIENVSIDGNGVSDGIHVEQGGKLNYSSGKISYSAEYGVKCQGTAALNAISMDNALHTGIYSENGGKVYMEDCSINHARQNFVYIEKGGYAEVTGTSVFEKSICRGFWNEGTLVVQGDEVGEEQEKTIQILDTYIAFLNQNSGETTINGAEVDTSSRSAVYALDGIVNVADSCFVKQQNAAIQAEGTADVTIKDTIIEECNNAGVYAAENSKVTFSGMTTMTNCRYGIYNLGGTVTGQGVTVNNATRHGVAVVTQDGYRGSVTLSDVHVAGAGYSGLFAETADMDISDATVSGCTENGVRSTLGADVKLKTITVEDCVQAGVFVTKDSAIDFSGTSKINECRHGVHSQGGTVTGQGVSVDGADLNGIAVTSQDNVKGSVTLTNVDIIGTVGSGLYAEGGILNITTGTVKNCTGSTSDPGNGVRSIAGSEVTLKDITVDNCASVGLYAGEKSSIGLSGITTINNCHHGIHSQGGTITGEGVRINTANTHGVVATAQDGVQGTITLSDVNVSGAGNTGFYAENGVLNITGGIVSGCTSYGTKATSSAEVTLTDVTVKDSSSATGLYAEGNSTISLSGTTTISSCHHGIRSHGGNITGEGVVVNTVNAHGILATAPGTITLSDVNVSGAGNAGLYAENSGVLDVTDGTVSGCADSGVKSITNASITLKDVIVKNCKTNINVGNTTTCTIDGTSVVTSATERGVFVAGTFIMNAGSIHNNKTSVNGSGVYVESTGKFTMNDGSFYENESSVNGGAIFANGGVVEIKTGKFQNNKASGRGGVIYLTGTADVDYNLIIEGGIFQDNSAGNNPYGGGVMYLESTTAWIKGGTFYSNDSSYRGGAIQTNGTVSKMCQLKITGGNFTYNESKLQGGGTIGLCHTTADISGVTMTNNFCSSKTTENYMGGGAILIQENAVVTLSNCTINNNTNVGTTDNKGYDIGFKADVNSKLILSDTTFDGLIGLDFGSTEGTVVVLDGSESTVSKGVVYTVDYTNKCLSPKS